jgi:hypothetical protein
MSIKLPIECLIEIFEFIVQQNFDYITLRSCSLVNRQWSAAAIPILWEEPLMNLQSYELTRDKICMPITTYIMCLSDESKTILSKCGIKITPTLKRRATFNYISYLRQLDNVILFDAAEMWIEKCNTMSKEEQCFSQIFQIYQLLEQLYSNFMINCDNLRQLHLRRSDQIKSLSDVFLKLHFFPGAEKSLTWLNEFSFDGCMEPEIFFKASGISNNIQHLCINCVCKDNKGLAELIRAQQRPLLSLSIETTTNLQFPSIENSLKNKVNFLTSLSINRMFSMDAFSNCNNLEKLTITHREPFGEDLMEKFVNTKFRKLSELQLQLDFPYLYQISTLIKNTRGSLTSIYLYWITPQDTNNFSLLITTIIMYCPNLTEYLGSYANSVINYFLPLFFQKCSKLEYFYIYDNGSTFYDISNVMKSISKNIPKNLKMMWLSESWTCNTEALSLFLESCEKILSNPLLFYMCNRTHQHDEIIKRYIVKNVLTNN